MNVASRILVCALMIFLGLSHLQAQQHGQNHGRVRSHPNSNITYFGDWSNTGTFTGNSGSAFFNGRSRQKIGGTNRIDFQYIRINNTQGIEIEVPILVTSEMYFQQGSIVTPRATPSVAVSFDDESGHRNASNSRHINGYCSKLGNDSFYFPVGNGQVLRGISMSAPPEDDAFSAAYFRDNPSVATLPVGAPFPITTFSNELSKISAVEYWDVDGSLPVRLTLYWNLDSRIQELTDGNLSRLTVVGWDGSRWVSLGKTHSAGNLAAGNITSRRVIPNDYQVITMGVLKDVPVCNPPILELGTAKSICSDSSIVLNATNNYAHYLWQDGSKDSVFKATAPGRYWVSVWDACGNEQTDTIEITRKSTPDIKTKPASCFGRKDAEIIINGNIEFMQIFLNGTPHFVSQFIKLEPDTYRLQIQSALYCPIDTNIIFKQPMKDWIDLGSDTMSVLFGKPFELASKPMENFKPVRWAWSPAENVQCAGCAATQATVTRFTVFEVMAMDSSGCYATDRIMVSLKEDSTTRRTDLYVPNTFRPEKETYKIFGTGKVLKVNSMQIFDRWGELVFEAKDFVPNGTVEWDGTFKGQYLNVASFVCVIEYQMQDGTKHRMATDVLLVR